MLPLQGITVVEIAQNLAGPVAAEILAHMGADVIKIERPEGDDARRWGPPFWKGVSPGFLAVNANKRSVTLDLKKPDDVEWLVDFIGRADVLVQNLRPGSLEEQGLGAAALTARHPRLVYCSVWAFGATGPLRLKPGYEPMVQAFSGLMAMNGEEGSPPTRIGTSILDYGTGMWTAIGALAGLVQRQQTGRGCIVDASLFETGPRLAQGPLRVLPRVGRDPRASPDGQPPRRAVPGLRDEDGRRSSSPRATTGSLRSWRRCWATRNGRTDPRFTTNGARVANKPVLLAEIERILMTRSKGEWIDLLEAAGVPCGPIHTLPEAVAQPQAAAIGMIQPMPGDDFELVALPLSFDGARPGIRRAPPKPGEHTREIRGG